ncbi:hypothetical protein MRB53_010512 [Persea americana]|uniref:Uncharacterized protein n=1 Tax=Persea americana TaxID=3435 RepID=A0ACC2LSD0_PERAE|nr:hypothetical protein MRB53_010512 [Persea americana]
MASAPSSTSFQSVAPGDVDSSADFHQLVQAHQVHVPFLPAVAFRVICTCKADHVGASIEIVQRVQDLVPQDRLLVRGITSIRLFAYSYSSGILVLDVSTMLHLELPHINVLSKIDLIKSYGKLAFNLDFYTDVQDLSYLQFHLDQDPRSAKYRYDRIF